MTGQSIVTVGSVVAGHHRETYVGLLSDSTQNIAVRHDDNVLFGSAAEVMSDPLGTVVERSLVGGVEALLASPVGGKRRKVKALELGVTFEHLLGGTSVAGEVVALLQLRQQYNLAETTESLNSWSVADLGALQGALERRREDDLRTRLEILSERRQSARLLLTERCQRRIWDRVVVGDILQQ